MLRKKKTTVSPLQETYFVVKDKMTESMEYCIPRQTESAQARAARLLCEKANFKKKTVRDKESHCTLVKRTIHGKVVIIVSTFRKCWSVSALH